LALSGSAPNKFYSIRETLNKNKNLNIIDVQDILSKYKGELPLYFRTDLHWNYMAVHIVSKAIVNLIGNLSGNNVLWNDNLSYNTTSLKGGNISLHLGVMFPPQDIYQKISVGSFCGNLVLPPPKPFGMHYKESDKCKKPLLPTTVLTGDSFQNYFEGTVIVKYFQIFTDYGTSISLEWRTLLIFYPKGRNLLFGKFMSLGFSISWYTKNNGT
jgi:hypothetical protein